MLERGFVQSLWPARRKGVCVCGCMPGSYNELSARNGLSCLGMCQIKSRTLQVAAVSCKLPLSDLKSVRSLDVLD